MKKKVVNIEVTNGEKRLLKMVACFALVMVLAQIPVIQTYASDFSEVTSPFDTLQELVGTVVSSIGYILTLVGIGELGISYQGSEGTMQANAYRKIGGGFLAVMAPQILAILI